ncbi:MAG: ligase-associated DNA damage response endonuclease PdeM [Sphingobium sp.]|nr:ligase-associated DNA damage response endonuclease PdeM [Sphingobium sp.]
MTCSPFRFGGQSWRALPEGALYWHERRALIVADLHLEKASAFATRGQMLPPYDSLATLAELESALARSDAREVWCLGDSLHDDAGAERMTDAVVGRLAALTGRVRWMWITGNHDPNPSPRLGGECCEEAEVDGVLLRHEAVTDEQRPELSGHFHPKWRMSLRGRSVSRRCFVMGARKLILPSFGAFTGGLDACAPPIRGLVGSAAEALVPLPDRLLRFPLPARTPA